MTFRVGQRIVCVDDRVQASWSRQWVHRGTIYTVSRLRNDILPGKFFAGLDYTAIDLVEVHKPGGFAPMRFRPLVEKQTDISIFTEILRKATKKERA